MEYPSEFPHGIMFHNCHNERHPKRQGSLSQEDFEDLLQFVGIQRILSPLEWLEKLEHNQLQPDDLCLTFDDALRCQFEIALPILEKYKLRAFWFVYSSVFEGHVEKMEIYGFFRSTCFQDIDDFYDCFFRRVFESEFSTRAKVVLEERTITQQRACFPFYSVNDVKFRLIRDRALGKQPYERIMDEMVLKYGLDISELSKVLWMSNDHLQYLSDHEHLVGLHSYSHPMVLAELPAREQFQEYEKNYVHINAVCHQAPVAMAHPANSYTDETLDILKRLGIRCGFRSNMVPTRGSETNPSPWEMARQDHANIMRMLNS